MAIVIDEDALQLVVKAELTVRIFRKKKAEAAMVECRRALAKGYVLTVIDRALKAVEICVGEHEGLYLDASYIAYGIHQRTMAEFRHYAKEIVNEARS